MLGRIYILWGTAALMAVIIIYRGTVTRADDDWLLGFPESRAEVAFGSPFSLLGDALIVSTIGAFCGVLASTLLGLLDVRSANPIGFWVGIALAVIPLLPFLGAHGLDLSRYQYVAKVSLPRRLRPNEVFTATCKLSPLRDTALEPLPALASDPLSGLAVATDLKISGATVEPREPQVLELFNEVSEAEWDVVVARPGRYSSRLSFTPLHGGEGDSISRSLEVNWCRAIPYAWNIRILIFMGVVSGIDVVRRVLLWLGA